MDYGRREQSRERPRSQPPVSGGAPSGGQGSPDPHSAPQVPSWRPPSWEDFRRMQPAPGSSWGMHRGGGPMWGGRDGGYRHDEHYRKAFEDWWKDSRMARHGGYGSDIPGWAHDVFRARFGGRGGDPDRFSHKGWYSSLGREWVDGRDDRDQRGGDHGRRPMWGGRWDGYEGSPRERAWWAGHGYAPWGGGRGGPMWGGRGGGYMMGYRDAMREFRDRRGDRDHGRRGHGRRDRGRRDDRRDHWGDRRREYGYGPRNDNYASPWAFWRRMMWGY